MYRSVWDDSFFTKDRFTNLDAWMFLVSHAAHKQQSVTIKNETISISRGQVFRSIRAMADVFHWNVRTVMRFLYNAKSRGMIEYSATHNGTLITILNYNKYNGSGGQDSEEYNAEYNTEYTTEYNTECNAEYTHINNYKECKKNEKRMKKEASRRRGGWGDLR